MGYQYMSHKHRFRSWVGNACDTCSGLDSCSCNRRLSHCSTWVEHSLAAQKDQACADHVPSTHARADLKVRSVDLSGKPRACVPA